jgi:GntR family transcriptional regulator / MocR family aminotransferase
MGRKSGPVLEFLLRVDRSQPEPLYSQVEDEIRDAIRSGRLGAGTPLPSTRTLARELGVARSVIVDAYAQLCAEGYLQAYGGSQTIVAATAIGGRARPRARGAGNAPAAAYDFHPGLPDLAAFPAHAWARSLQRALQEAPHAVLGYPDPRGLPGLRDTLAAYLARARRTLADPDRMLICTGTVQGLSLTCHALRKTGATRIAVEDPCWIFHRTVATHAGLEVIPVPVDSEGIAVTELTRLAVDAVIITPAHQYPTGAVLPPGRRRSLLDWAAQRGATVIEDDYDAEYRYDRDPVGALQGLAPDRVVYAGSASKILAPALRIGWLLLPDHLTDALTTAKIHADLGSDALIQLALASFIDTGELDRHLRRSRRSYRARRDMLLDSIHSHFPDATIEGIAAGLHALALLPDGANDAALTAQAASQGVLVHGLSWHRAAPSDGPAGLILGYANLSEPAIQQGIRKLAEIRSEM